MIFVLASPVSLVQMELKSIVDVQLNAEEKQLMSESAEKVQQ